MPSLSMDSLPVKMIQGWPSERMAAARARAVKMLSTGAVGFDQNAAVGSHGHGRAQGVFRGRFSQAYGNDFVTAGVFDSGRFGQGVLVVGVHQEGDLLVDPFLPFSTVMVAAESGTCFNADVNVHVFTVHLKGILRSISAFSGDRNPQPSAATPAVPIMP
jgi:hypothetical protein